MTISIGVAEYREGETVESMIQRADSCLYRAKRGGRNCTAHQPG
ncbi:MAG: diguanylate cyclase domain-containing protein [Spirochaetota bacterium]